MYRGLVLAVAPNPGLAPFAACHSPLSFSCHLFSSTINKGKRNLKMLLAILHSLPDCFVSPTRQTFDALENVYACVLSPTNLTLSFLVLYSVVILLELQHHLPPAYTPLPLVSIHPANSPSLPTRAPLFSTDCHSSTTKLATICDLSFPLFGFSSFSSEGSIVRWRAIITLAKEGAR